MITAEFNIRDNGKSTFTVKGHSGSGVSGFDIVCAAVSSAVYMTANTITEILGEEAGIDVRDGYMHFLLGSPNPAAQDILRGLKLHLEALSEQYPDFIKVITEV